MSSIERIDKVNTQWVVEQLKSDVIMHVFAFYDIQYDPENTTMYAAVEAGKLRGIHSHLSGARLSKRHIGV